MTNTPTPVQPSTYAGEQAAELLSATGTANDGAIVPLVYPALAGLPVDSGNPLPVTQTNVAQETGGNLAAIVSALAGNLKAVLQAGSAIIGKVGIDQTTDGTTNAVHVNNLPATQAVSAVSLPLPAGAALEAGHLATIDTNAATVATNTGHIPAQGQALAAGSTPVVLTAIQQAALTPPATITGFALEAGHLATIDTSTARIPAQGQALAAASLPVVLTAAQQTALTPPAAITNYANETGGNLASLVSVEGATADAAVQGDTSGSISAKIRGLNKLAGTSSDTTASATLFGTLLKMASAVVSSIMQVSQNASTPVVATLQAAATGTGNGTTLNVTGMATAVMTLSGTFVGTVSWEVSEDSGTTWTAASPAQYGTPTQASTATAPGLFQLSVAGLTGVRARISAYTSGSITVTGHAVPVAFPHKGVTDQGNVASGVADTGNPVKVGGVYNSSFPAPSTGQRNDLQLDSTAALRVASRTNANRNGGVLHRSAITSADTLATVGTITLSAVASSTALANVAYYVTAAAYNRWGNALPGTIQTITPTATNLIRAAFAQVTGADGYDVFLSTSSTGPLWVGRITETQRASGILLTAVGTTGAGGTAGAVDIKIVGTGLGSNVAPFTVNNAYTPATPTPINCAGYSIIHWHVKVAVTDLRSLPTLAVIPFLQDQTSNTDFFMCQRVVLGLVTGAGQALEQDIVQQVDGSTGAVLLLDTLAGQGISVSAWAELS